MPTETIIVVSLICSAFTLFGVVLAYGEYQTRNFKRPDEEAKPVQERKQEWLKAA